MNGKQAIECLLKKEGKSRYWLGKQIGDNRIGYVMSEDMKVSTLTKLAEGLGYEVYILRKGSGIAPVKVSSDDK